MRDGLKEEAGELQAESRSLGEQEKELDARSVVVAADRRAGGVGKISNTYGSRSDLKSADQAIDHAADALSELAAIYLFGDAPFEPGEVAGYGEYDQLMRRDEWFGRGEEGA